MKLYDTDITDANFYGLNGIAHNFTIVYTHGCDCGAFDYNDCIAEKMVTIDNFAAAFVGNSRYGWFNEGQTEGPSEHLHREYMNALYSDSLNRIGRAHQQSKTASASFVTAPGQWEPGALRWCFYDCNVLGDPALAVYTDNPITINTSFPNSITVGTTSMNVTVTSAGTPVQGLNCVVIKDGVLIGQATTDANGQALINFDVLVTNPGDAQLHVSGYNCTLTTYDFAFIPAAGPYVVYAGSVVHDPSGNNNNQPDYDETILLTNSMRNVGSTNATNVMVTLKTTDPYIKLQDSTEMYSSIAIGDTMTIANAFQFKVSDTVPNGHQTHFVLQAVSGATWVSDFDLICYAPSLSSGSLMIDDSQTGNNNGKLDPGEKAVLNIPSINNGASNALNTIGTLTCNSPWVSIVTPTCTLGTVGAGSSVNAQFTINVSSQAPVGTIIELAYTLTSGGYLATTTYYPTIKLIVEDYESGNFNKFPWSVLGSYPWGITEDSPMEGIYCSKSATITNNQQSAMSITLDVLQNDSISFYSKVSSEVTFDKLQFMVDS